MSGFSFGGAAGTPAPGGFSFGNTPAPTAAPVAPTTAATPGGFSFGAPPNQTASTGFSFGATSTTQASSFSFKPNPTAATVPAGASLGSAIAATTTAPLAAPSGFSFGLGSTPAPATTTSSTPALSLSTPAAPKPLAFGVASTVANSSMKFGSVVPTTAAAAASSSSGGFSFGMPSASNPTTTSTPASLGLSAATASVPTTTTAPLFGTGNSQLTAPPATSTSLVTTSSAAAGAAAAPSLSLGGASSSIAATTSSVAASASLGLSTSTLTTSSAAAASATAASLNYRQLEEAINKWTLELEEQEKVFLNQATQVNAWDRMLMDNGEKIVKLHESVEKVKLDQQRLEHELDFVKSQQSELDEILRPLEGSLSDAPPPDAERERIYSLAENLDAQLQRMGDDLREIIEHLNSANRNTNDNDPIVQISRVLNAHMDALQWVDQTSNLVQKKLEDVTKLQGIRRKENERIGIL